MLLLLWLTPWAILAAPAVEFSQPPKDSRGGEAYRASYVLEAPVEQVWSWLRDVDSPLKQTRPDILEYRVTRQAGDLVMTEGLYDYGSQMEMRFRLLFDPDQRRMDYTLLKPGAYLQAFNYGNIHLQDLGGRTRVVHEGFIKGFTASIWVLTGMKDHFRRIAAWDAEAFTAWQRQHPATAPTRRAATEPPPPTGFSSSDEEAQRFAVIVGISRYQDRRIPSLNYAAADAKALYQWLIAPQGGGYDKQNVWLLLDEQATLGNIKDALFDRLKQTIEEDLVLIYFAGHGSPESPDFPENLYLLPYDTDFARVSSTAFPMWDVETALKRFIRARKVVVLADACHSGGVGKGYELSRRAAPGEIANPISQGFQDLSQVGDGVCVLSAASDRQFSREGTQWGGGHGVFTHFLLEGLKGQADRDGNRTVSLGELIPYVSARVRRATANAQSPTVAGTFDPALVIGQQGGARP